MYVNVTGALICVSSVTVTVPVIFLFPLKVYFAFGAFESILLTSTVVSAVWPPPLTVIVYLTGFSPISSLTSKLLSKGTASPSVVWYVMLSTLPIVSIVTFLLCVHLSAPDTVTD